MTRKNELYQCDVCGNIVSVLDPHNGELVCCNQPMNLLEGKTEDEGKEKHVPIIEKTEKGVRVKVGEVPHPMTDDHHIIVIQLLKDNRIIFGKRLEPGDEPSVEFCCTVKTDDLVARALCNKHGLWLGK